MQYKMWSHGRIWTTVLTLIVLVRHFVAHHSASAQKIAIIGGGISGSFSAKYLVDYDTGCSLESITLFDPLPIGEGTLTTEAPDSDWQGSRVASLELLSASNEKLVVELGAPMFVEDFRLLMDMIHGDSTLEMETASYPMDIVGQMAADAGFPILATTRTKGSTMWSKLKFYYRYNVDLWILSRATQKLQLSLRLIHEWLDHTDPSTFFESADDMWEAAGLQKPTHMTLDEFLDAIGLSDDLSWWRGYLPYQGSIRAELLTGLTLTIYNQESSTLNGLAGLSALLSSHADALRVVGGNRKLIRSAFWQARTNRQKLCRDGHKIRHTSKRVATLVGDVDGVHVFDSDSKSLGAFDVVILAAPIQLSCISFFVRSDKDGSILHDMPLGGRIDPADGAALGANEVFPEHLPQVLARPYAQVVSTIASNATLQPDRGKAKERNITVIEQLSVDKVYKVLSSDPLSHGVLRELFGGHVVVEYVKVWGGPNGGAAPVYHGNDITLPYLLYDSATGLDEGTLGGALYYPNSIESSSTGVGYSAIGAKSVAKIVARRLGVLVPQGGWDPRADDEL